MHIISSDENAKQIKINYIGSEFIGHANTETVVKAFKSLHVHNLAQSSMDKQNIKWKIVEMLKKYRKEKDPTNPMLLKLWRCGWHVLHEVRQTAQLKTNRNLDKVSRNCNLIFKKSSAKRWDYLEPNDLQESLEGKSAAYFFSF